MSMDTTDDLEYAEGVAENLAVALRNVLDADPPRVTLSATLREWEQYCRPTCRWRDEGECSGEVDLCGCPCEHGGEA